MVEFASRGGVRLGYERAGDGELPMIFVHGWCGDLSFFAPQVEHFARRHAVVAADLRGHGSSDGPEPGPDSSYDIAELADDVLAVAAAAGLDRPVLVGHSLGALVGLACAARPTAIRALVMVDPAPVTNEAVKTNFLEWVDTVAADHDRSWRTAFVNSMFLPTDVARRDEIVTDMARVPPAIAADLMRAMGEFDGADALSQVSVPVLSIGSASPTNRSADLRDRCLAITIAQTAGSGHFCQIEVPEQVNAMIDRFLAVSGITSRA